jgi:MraZ protein
MENPSLDFTGRYDHTIDDKGRLMLPAILRDELAKSSLKEKVYLGFYPGTRFLSLYPAERYEVLAAAWKDEKRFPSANLMQDAQRLFFANIEPINVDRSGRILIPALFRDRAGLRNECAVLGVGEKIELWSQNELIAKEALSYAAWEKACAEENSRPHSSEEVRLPSF